LWERAGVRGIHLSEISNAVSLPATSGGSGRNYTAAAYKRNHSIVIWKQLKYKMLNLIYRFQLDIFNCSARFSNNLCNMFKRNVMQLI